MDFSNFIFRSHYQGDLVSIPKPLSENTISELESFRERNSGIGKPLTEKQSEKLIELEYKFLKSTKFELSTTAQKLLTKIYFAQKFNRDFRLENKYFDKGILVEKESRDTLSELLNIRLVSDPQEKQNDWVRGKRDIKSEKVIIDIKSTWDFNTFGQHLIESNEEFYFRQLDNYMELWGINEALLAYVLTDTPFHLINQEITNKNYKMQFLDNAGNIPDARIPEVKKIVCDHIFTRKSLESFCNESASIQIEWFNDFIEIPIQDRVHLVPHTFDPIRIKQRNECLRLGREFLNNIKAVNNINFKL